MFSWLQKLMETRPLEPAIPKGYEEELLRKLNKLSGNGLANGKDYRCVPYTGKISHLNDRVAVIDQQYYFHVQNTKLSSLKIGDVVSCDLYINDNDTLVKKVELVENGCVESVEATVPKPKRREDGELYPIRGTIVKKVLRDITVECDDTTYPNVTFNMDNVCTEFIPQPGDVVKLGCRIMKTRGNDNELVVEEIEPKKATIESGVVTSWNSIHGSISNCAHFSITCCEPGYHPAEGDRVLASLIRSDIKHFTWRAIQVIPQCRAINFRLMEESEKTRLELLMDKGGIEIGTCGFIELLMGDKKKIVIEVINQTSYVREVISCTRSSNVTVSQIEIVEPTQWPIQMDPKSSVPFKFEINAQFLGRSTEFFVWKFNGFEIGRQFEFDVVDPNLNPDQYGGVRARFRGNRREVTASQLMARASGLIINGRRSFCPAAFVPVKLGQFALSDKLLMAALPENKLNLDDLMIRVSEVLPCLKKDLSRDTYMERMHGLLYLEEVAMLKQVGELQMLASFRKVGDCLVLDVPALSPYTTKLVAGDMVIASADESSTSKAFKYEGIIHRVTRTELMLKFAEQFHEESFSETTKYSISFVTSRASLRRMHQAISLAVKHLGMSWLFPSAIRSREPQVIAEDELPDACEDDGGSESASQPLPPELLNMMKDLPKGCGRSTMKQLLEDWTKTERGINEEKVVKEELLLYGPDPRKVSIQGPPSQLSLQERLRTPASGGLLFDRTEQMSRGRGSRGRGSRGRAARGQRRGRVHWNRHGSGYGVHCTLNSESTYNIRAGQKSIIKWFNRGLNKQQKDAVKNALAGESRPLPYILFGPPGTGKTVTVVETILQLYTHIPQCRLLVATPSNSAADLITERLLMTSADLKQNDLLRMVGYHYLEQGRISALILPYSSVPDVRAINISGTSGSSHEGVKMSGREQIGSHRITVCTLGCVGLMYNMGFPRGHFTHIVIDEAGQATEPEVLIAMIFLHMQFGQVILAGDPLQLGPVVTSRLAARCGLQESLLARLLSRYPYAKDTSSFPDSSGYDPRLVTKLVNNYRSLPKILKLPSMLFYDGDLIAKVCEETSQEAKVLVALDMKIRCSSNGKAPQILFHGIRGKNEQESDSHSWYNPQEISQVLLYIMTLYTEGITSDQIGVITPYQLQSNKIRFMLDMGDVPAPKVGSVEEFQGQERMVIIVSVVRSSPEEITFDMQRALGFVANARRLNVALSRARAMLIIVGNPHLLSLDMHWRSVLQYCVNTNAYVGCDLPSDATPIKFRDESVKKDISDLPTSE